MEYKEFIRICSSKNKEIGTENIFQKIRGLLKISDAPTLSTQEFLSFPKLNSQWFKHPLLQDFFVKNIGKYYAYDYLAMLLKFYWLNFEKKCQDSSCPSHMTSSRHGIN